MYIYIYTYVAGASPLRTPESPSGSPQARGARAYLTDVVLLTIYVCLRFNVNVLKARYNVLMYVFHVFVCCV